MNIKDQICAEIERQKIYARGMLFHAPLPSIGTYWQGAIGELEYLRTFLDTLPEQPVSDHHEIEVEFRGEKVTISREFYRNGERNYSTGEQDDNAIWSALRAWCEKKGITPFELYPKQPEQSDGLEEEISRTYHNGSVTDTSDLDHNTYENIARHFYELGRKRKEDK